MNISGDFADTVCIGGKTHGVRLFAFIYKEGCPGVRTALFCAFPKPGASAFLCGRRFGGCVERLSEDMAVF